MKVKYVQALLQTEDCLFAVSVPSEVAIDERRRIANPQSVFEDGSTLVAVEQGVPTAGEYVEHPNPFDIEQAEAKTGGNGGKPQPSVVRIRNTGPRFGSFMLRHTDGGGVILQPVPSIGEFFP